METSLSRNEKLLGLVALGMITVFAAFFVKLNSSSKASASHIETGSQINYQMARPAESFSEYSLNGREIDQTYEGLHPREVAQLKKAEAAKVAGAKPKAEVDKKAEAAKKKSEDAQKAAAQARAAQAEQARKTALENRAREQQAAAQTKSETNSPKSANPSENSGGGAGAVNANNVAASPVAPVDDKSKDKDKKTFAEWRSLIFATPKTATIDTFLAAYRKGDVTATEVQAMAQDLLDQNSESLKGLGLYTLRSTPSMASLSQLVHIESQMSSTYQTYIEQAYLAYFQAGNVGYLNQALQTSDQTLISKTLSLLSTNLPKVAQNSSLGDGRDTRGGSTGSTITMSQFSVLLTSLATLSQNAAYTNVAQQLISYIQSGNVAQN